MAKSWPAVDVRYVDDPDLLLALVDDFSPTALEDHQAGVRIFFATAAARSSGSSSRMSRARRPTAPPPETTPLRLAVLQQIAGERPIQRDVARLDGSRLLDQQYHDALLQLDRGTTLVFQCHHGIRSQAAAEYLRLVRNAGHSFRQSLEEKEKRSLLVSHTGRLEPEISDVAFLYFLRLLTEPDLIRG